MRGTSLHKFATATVVVGLVLAACSGDDAADKEPATSEGTTAETIAPSTSNETSVVATDPPTASGLEPVTYSAPGGGQEVDSISWALPFEVTSFDPIKAWAYPENTVMANMCEGIFTLTPDLQLEPRLASSVDVSDPTKIVITVRPDATFWDGQPVTAEDVAYSLGRNLDPALGGYFGSAWTNATSVDVTGDDEVTISLKAPDLLLWKWLATGTGIIVEKAFSEAAGEAMGTPDGGIMCSGPYELTSWVPGDSITITKNDDYWDPAVDAKVNQVVFRSIPESSAMTSALLTGDVDGSFTAPTESIQQMLDSDVGTLYAGKSTQSTLLIPNVAGPFGDVRLRQALALVVDRTLIADVAFGGTASPGKSIDTPLTWGYGNDIFQSGYDALPSAATPDVAAAQALVDEYVAENGPLTEPLTMWVSGDREVWTLTGNAIADAAAAIGIPMTVVAPPIQDFANWLYDPATREETDLYLSPWWTDLPDPLQAFLPITLPGIFNPFNYSNPEVDQLLAEASATPDGPERAQLVDEARAIMFGTDMMWIPLVDMAASVFINNRISGAPVSMPAYLYYPWATEMSGN